MPRVLVITNTDAGGNDDAEVDSAVSVLTAGGFDVDVVATQDAGELDAVLSGRQDRDIMVAGGDGSLHAVVAALYARGELGQPVLGLLPLGTGNDFARGIELPLDAADAAQVFVSGRKVLVDVLVDEQGCALINAVHCGVGAEAGREAAPWKDRFGKLGYLVGALKAGFASRGYRLRIVADGTVLANGHRRVLQAVVANASFVGGGTRLAPDADPTDGLADVLVSFAVGRRDRLLYGIHLKRGAHHDRHDVQTVRATRVSIRGGSAFWSNADGELAGPVKAKSWTLHPQSVSMMLPTPDQAQPFPTATDAHR